MPVYFISFMTDLIFPASVNLFFFFSFFFPFKGTFIQIQLLHRHSPLSTIALLLIDEDTTQMVFHHLSPLLASRPVEKMLNMCL